MEKGATKHLFTSEEGKKANRKRKRRYGPVTRDSSKSIKVKEVVDRREEARDVARLVNSRFLNERLFGIEEYSATSVSGIDALIEALHQTRAFSRDSVFVDFGSGSGAALLYVATRFECRCIGVERVKELAEFAQQQSALFAGSSLVHSQVYDFALLASDWLASEGATHLLCADAALQQTGLRQLYGRLLARCPSHIVGASSARHSSYWPPELLPLCSVPAVKLHASTKTHEFLVWKIKPK